jgi:hypothetical protein
MMCQKEIMAVDSGGIFVTREKFAEANSWSSVARPTSLLWENCQRNN